MNARTPARCPKDLQPLRGLQKRSVILLTCLFCSQNHLQTSMPNMTGRLNDNQRFFPNLCGFSVFHCVEGAFGASSGGTPKMRNGAPRDELKNGRGRGWAVPYDLKDDLSFPKKHFPFTKKMWEIMLRLSETGRIRFRGVRFQTPNSVSFRGSLSSGERTQ